MPEWGADLSGINFDEITYFARATKDQSDSWEDLPEEIRETYDKIGVPEAERNFLAGVSAQYDSEVVYEKVQEQLGKQGVIFCDMDTALQKYPEIVKEYFATLIPPYDNKFAALNTATWSGGSFVYVPKGIKAKVVREGDGWYFLFFFIDLAFLGQVPERIARNRVPADNLPTPLVHLVLV
jgi:Fe-S cluster assembly protein SufB